MKTSLNIRQANVQTINMTPQLQQAIRLLQLSTQELQLEIQENLEKNPLLEIDESSKSDNLESLDAMAEREQFAERADDDFNPFNNDRTISQDDAPYQGSEEASCDPSPLEGEKYTADTPDFLSQVAPDRLPNSEMPDKSSNAESWKDSYSASTAIAGKAFDGDSEMYQGETSWELKDYLLWQLNLTHVTDKDNFIAEAIIDGIDDSGYLTESLDDILKAVILEYPETELDEIEAVLKLVQHFDPVGVASRNVQESLQIQLRQFDLNDPVNKLAMTIIDNYLELLGNKDYRALLRKLNVREDTLKKAVKVITSLEPRPGNCIKHEKSEFIIPDVIVFKRDGKWVADLNPEAVPKLQINETYSNLCLNAKNAGDAQFIKTRLKEANWFILSLNKRNETLLKVARCIAAEQQDFFEKGELAMKPMVLNDVADQVGMHESTISRVTTEKYLYTPRGTFELKYFFSSHVNTDQGGEFSSTAIRALIKELVSKEDPMKPLSDSQLSDLLKEKGIIVARRTVAKYRDSLNIPSSSQRKNIVG